MAWDWRIASCWAVPLTGTLREDRVMPSLRLLVDAALVVMVTRD